MTERKKEKSGYKEIIKERKKGKTSEQNKKDRRKKE